jgi:hypothetical protein
MNKAQEIHVKERAHTIEMHAEAIKLRMQALQRNSLAGMPTDVIGVNFQDVLYYCEAMQKVVNSMLAGLLPADSEENEPEKCEVCDKVDVPFIKVEASEDESGPHWLLVCSDECLEKVVLRWQQIGEIIRP